MTTTCPGSFRILSRTRSLAFSVMAKTGMDDPAWRRADLPATSRIAEDAQAVRMSADRASISASSRENPVVWTAIMMASLSSSRIARASSAVVTVTPIRRNPRARALPTPAGWSIDASE